MESIANDLYLSIDLHCLVGAHVSVWSVCNGDEYFSIKFSFLGEGSH